jgi:AcrR family transcriptional regulator
MSENPSLNTDQPKPSQSKTDRPKTDRPKTGRPKNGRPNTLSQQSILDAAMQLLKSEGESGLSMRRIATHLEVSPTSLYGYFANKDSLLAALAQHFYSEMKIEWPAEADWSDAIRYWLNHWRDNITQSPDIMVLAGLLATTQRGLQELENIAQLLLPLSGSEAEAVAQAQSLFWMVLSFCTFEQMASEPKVMKHLQQHMHTLEPNETSMVSQYLAVTGGFDRMWELSVERNIRGLQSKDA